jgi:hypothetical protein
MSSFQSLPSLFSRILPAAILAAASLSSANEHRFGYVYETGVLAPGAKEIEVYTTLRAGRDRYYSALDQRIAFEVGVADNLMTAFYLNMRNTSEADALGGMHTAFEWKGISSEWKYKLLDPVADAVGLGLYGEFSYNTDGMDLEPKILLDKQAGRWLFAANLIAEFEYEATGDEMELEEIAPDLTLGATFAVSQSFHAGLEARNHNAFVKTADEEMEHEFSALYLGPVVSYATESWWMTFSLLPQLPALAKEDGGSILVLDDGERFNARLLFSFHI